MTTMDREPNQSLDYVVGRLEGVVDTLQDLKTGQAELSRRVDQSNDRIDKLVFAILGVGGGLLVAVIGGMIGLGWLIVQTG